MSGRWLNCPRLKRLSWAPRAHQGLVGRCLPAFLRCVAKLFLLLNAWPHCQLKSPIPLHSVAFSPHPIARGCIGGCLLMHWAGGRIGSGKLSGLLTFIGPRCTSIGLDVVLTAGPGSTKSFPRAVGQYWLHLCMPNGPRIHLFYFSFRLMILLSDSC